MQSADLPSSTEARNMKPSPGQTPVRFEYSARFPEILNHLQSSLAITTYQAGKLAVVGVNGGQLDFSFHDFEQAMGMPSPSDRGEISMSCGLPKISRRILVRPEHTMRLT